MTKRPPGPPLALTIAGSDSCGGAGAQADLRAFHAFGLRGASALTALTAQNPREVRGVFEVPPAFVVAQVRAVRDHERPAAVKTGMLATAAIVEAVAAVLAETPAGQRPPLVVDPVMVATSGARLLDEDAIAAVVSVLMPLADVVTPNLHEAAVLTGRDPEEGPGWTRDEQADAARRIMDRGARAVLVKGGHRAEGADDVLASGAGLSWLRAPWVNAPTTHGTGCTLAAAIAAGLALGHALPQAVALGKEHVTRALGLGLDRPLRARGAFEFEGDGQETKP